MGWLDHSTNNIILDAVLTDYGRQKLATLNEGFKLDHFELGDDEVDYRLIKKFGRTVGKEKIEKNTPVFEAFTNQSIALKYPLISLQDVGLSVQQTSLPYFTYTGTLDLSDALNQGIKSITIKYFLGTTPVSISAQSPFTVSISDRFFEIRQENSTNVAVTLPTGTQRSEALSDPNRTVKYTLTSLTTVANATEFTVQVAAKRNELNSSVLSIYGTATGVANQRKITSNMVVRGTNGTSIIIPITYTGTIS